MTYEQIHTLFKQGYNQANWKKFLGETFTHARLLATPETLTDIDSNVASKALKLGSITLNENGIERQIAVYEVQLAKGIILERNRVGLRNLLRKYWKNIDAAFIVYHNPDASAASMRGKWRFSYVSELTGYDAEGEFIKIKTEPKRYTYVLGEGESTRTAAERFALLAQKANKATLDDVKEAFSVEKLSKAFFDEYKKHYDLFCQFMMKNPGTKAGIFNGDEKAIRDFNKKLLGRIVFLYFIQKKGWMGVPVGSQWGQGDFNFLTNLFKQHKNPDLFYSDVLTRLFFDTLNTNRNDDIIELVKGQPCRIPYLNGGLFEEDDPKHRNIIIDGKLFENLFDFFNQYNFTIYEDDPNDHTVAVDPEMLGHIFENLLEDNKDKGAFYTPKEIVHYMCQESLTEYLKNSPPSEGNFTPLTWEQKVSKLVKQKDASLLGAGELEYISKKLDTVKICDPAIGSGAFPMGLLQEIHAIKEVIACELQQPWNPAEVKENIIQNSIYGVDIEKGAVDIARLRFWLSLVVDEEKPRPLPNLDYKIVVGNSLVSKFEGEIIEIDWEVKEGTQIDMFSNEKVLKRQTLLKQIQLDVFSDENVLKRQTLLEQITAKQKEYFHATHKQKLATEIRDLKIDLLINQLELMIKTKGIEFKPDESDKKAVAQMERWRQTQRWKNTIAKLQKLKENTKEPFNHFDWKLDFPEVLNPYLVPDEKQRGFDIVIGNPPYVNIEKIDQSIKDNVSKFKTAYQKYDLYVLFYEVALNLLKEKGILSFITSNKFLSQGYGLKLRQEFLLYRIDQIVNFNYDIFESATVRTCIVQISKTTPKSSHNIKVIDINSIKDKENFTNRIVVDVPQKTFDETEENTFRINLTKEKIALLNRIKKDTLALFDICSINYGLRPSSEKLGLKKEAFIYEAKSKAEFKTYFEGKDMGYWLVNNISYLDYKPDIMYNAMFPELFENEKLVGLRTLSDITKLRFIYDDNGYYCNDSVVVVTLWYKLKNVEYSTIKRTITKQKIATSEKYSYKYLQAILNSKLIKFYVNELFYDGTHFYPNHMKSLPIKVVSLDEQAPLIKIVDKIHNKLKVDINANISDLEQQIDNLVFRLYELSYEEVKVIDPAFPLSKEEYENIKIE